MQTKTKVPLTIAGFDPSSGAGLTADLLTFNHFGLSGVAVCTAITHQNNLSFKKVEWVSINSILEQLEVLSDEFDFEYAKIGLIENITVLQQVIDTLLKINPQIKIIWDPILKASAGFDFKHSFLLSELEKIFQNLYLITPNKQEANLIFKHNDESFFQDFVKRYNLNLVIKSYNETEKNIADALFTINGIRYIETPKITGSIHGSGCKYSSAVLSNLVLNKSLSQSCEIAQEYVKMLILKRNFDQE